MHVYRHRVRYHETDAQGYTFNARYLEIADVAMTEFLRSLGHRFQDLTASGFDPSLVTAQLQFRKPTHLDDDIDIDAACTHVGRSSFAIRYAMTVDGVPVCDIDITYVNVDAAAEESRPLDDVIAAALRSAMPDAQ